MQLTSTSFANGRPILAEFAFCAIDAKTHTTLSLNRNPHFAWSDAPAVSKSFARICHDSDVPSKGVDVNQEGRSVPTALPRVDFFHWVLIDIPASVSNMAAGEFSSSVTTRQSRSDCAERHAPGD